MAATKNLIIASQSIEIGKDLSQEQYDAALDRLMETLPKRLEALKVDMGWSRNGAYQNWMEKRDQAQKEYENDFRHRENANRYSALYRICNNSINIPKRCIQISVAKTNEQLLNSSPWVEVNPKGPDSKEPAVKWLAADFQEELERCNAQSELREAIRQMDTTGETVMKVTVPEENMISRKFERAWMVDGQAMKDAEGNPIGAGEVWERTLNVVGQEHLRRTPSIIKPPNAALSKDRYKWTTDVKKKRLDITGLHWADFFCPLEEESIHSASHIHHQFAWDYDKVQKYVRAVADTLEGQEKDWYDELRKRGFETTAESGSGQPNQIQGEKSKIILGECTGKILLVESWFRFDLLDDGNTEEFMLLWDVEKEQPIAWERMEYVSPTGARPFKVLRRIKVKKRWYGMGYYEFLSNEHGFIDRNWSRIDVRNTAGGRFTYVQKDYLPEVVAGKPFQLNSGHMWQVAKDCPDPSKVLGHIPLPAMDEGIWEILKHAEQAAQLMTGTMTPGDAAVSGFKQTNTATGAEILNQQSDLLSADLLQGPREGIEELLQLACAAWYNDFSDYHMSIAADHVGGENALELGEYVSARGVTHLLRSIKLLLTKLRSRQQLQSNQQAWTIMFGGRSYVDLTETNPNAAEKAKPLAIKMLSALDIDDPDKIVDIAPPPPVPGPGQPGQPQPQQMAA